MSDHLGEKEEKLENQPGRETGEETVETQTLSGSEPSPAETKQVPGEPGEFSFLVQGLAQLAEKVENIDPRKIGMEAAGEVKLQLQSFYNKIIDRLEDPKGRYTYKLQSSFLKGLIGIYDFLQELERIPWQPGEGVHLKNYKALGTQLLQVFLMHDLEPVIPAPGESFNPRIHRAAGIDATPITGEDGLVSGCMRPGFVFRDVVVRPADVKIKKYVRQKEDEKKEPGDSEG
jgi:molecular chaperone GrpE (heat shock protein)